MMLGLYFMLRPRQNLTTPPPFRHAGTMEALIRGGLDGPELGTLEKRFSIRDSNSDAVPVPLHLCVFVSSPGDVTDERALAKGVIDRLERERAHRNKLRLEIVAWDVPGAATAMPAHLEPQEALNQGLKKPSECDIVIVIFGYRMGTPLSDKYLKPNGDRYRSGTEYEYLDALNAARGQEGFPQILVYRKEGAPDVNAADTQRAEKLRQWDQVVAFFTDFKHPDGSFRSFYHEYRTPTEFKDRLDQDLRDIVARLLEKHAPA